MQPGGSGQLPPICWGGHNFKTFIGRYRRFIAHPELKTSKIYSVFRSIVSQKENGLHHHHHRFFFLYLNTCGALCGANHIEPAQRGNLHCFAA